MAVGYRNIEITTQVRFGLVFCVVRKGPKTLFKPQCMTKHYLRKLFIMRFYTNLVYKVSPKTQQILNYQFKHVQRLGKTAGLFYVEHFLFPIFEISNGVQPLPHQVHFKGDKFNFIS